MNNFSSCFTCNAIFLPILCLSNPYGLEWRKWQYFRKLVVKNRGRQDLQSLPQHTEDCRMREYAPFSFYIFLQVLHLPAPDLAQFFIAIIFCCTRYLWILVSNAQCLFFWCSFPKYFVTYLATWPIHWLVTICAHVCQVCFELHKYFPLGREALQPQFSFILDCTLTRNIIS